MGWGYLFAEKANVKDTRFAGLLIVNPMRAVFRKPERLPEPYPAITGEYF
jgi:hypothetical protein